ncbi:YdcF family protein [Chitinimonas koreensis]|uniref:YdcF family protein n=1 Tax=Chitinimonas koreensis TaxID=356302 RepID=UPI000490E428|nr:YdcF family protein [Chitinimonas koreensis]QNM97005.1 YdcF family protein [Chitinimonas koreensis]
MTAAGPGMLFWLKKLCSALLLPPVLPLLLVLAGLLLLRRRPRRGCGLAVAGLLALWLCSAPVGVRLLLEPLESAPPAGPAALRQAQAIVVLAGGRDRVAPEYGGETISAITLARLRYGARLARQTGLPLLLSGGAPSGGLPEAVLMDQSLRQDFGLAARWLEAGSLDTAGNADASARLLLPAGIRRVALVSDAAHLPRAAAEFRRAGFAVIAAPTRYQGGSLGRFAWLPSGEAAMAGHYAAHEWLGLLAQRLRG